MLNKSEGSTFTVVLSTERTDVGIEVPVLAGSIDLLAARATEQSLAMASNRELLFASSHGEVECVNASFGIDGHRGLAAACHRQLGRLFQHGAGKDNVLEKITTSWYSKLVAAALSGFGVGTVPIYKAFGFNSRRTCTSLVSRDVWLHELAPSSMWEVSSPLRRTIIGVVRLGITAKLVS